jgi:hypothetical protein
MSRRVQRVGDIEPEGHDAVLVQADALAVDKGLAAVADALEFEEDLFPAASLGGWKCLRYQATPVRRLWMSLAKASSSFHGRGNVTGFQDESSNVGASAPFGSPTISRQPGSKL